MPSHNSGHTHIYTHTHSQRHTRIPTHTEFPGAEMLVSIFRESLNQNMLLELKVLRFNLPMFSRNKVSVNSAGIIKSSPFTSWLAPLVHRVCAKTVCFTRYKNLCRHSACIMSGCELCVAYKKHQRKTRNILICTKQYNVMSLVAGQIFIFPQTQREHYI